MRQGRRRSSALSVGVVHQMAEWSRAFTSASHKKVFRCKSVITHSSADSKAGKSAEADVVGAIERECHIENKRQRTGHPMQRPSPRQRQSISRHSTPCSRSTPSLPQQSAKTSCGSTTRTRPPLAADRSRGPRSGWKGASRSAASSGRPGRAMV
jgi:hypothetical protein